MESTPQELMKFLWMQKGADFRYREAYELIDILRQQNQELRQLARLGNSYTDPNQCRKCGHLYNRGYCCINCGDSDPSEPKENTNERD